MLAHPRGPEATSAFDTLRRYVAEAGRDPKAVGLEIWTSVGEGDEDQWREEFGFWKSAGVTHVTLNNAFGRFGHRRMAGRSLADHLAAVARYWAAVSDLR